MPAQELEGTWQGRLKILLFGQDVRFVIHFVRDSIDHTYTGIVDIPDQKEKNVDVDVEVREDSLFLSFPTFNGDYAAKYNPDSAAYLGIFKQLGAKLNFKLVKGDADDLVYYRPQKPKKPYPYHEEEVMIENKQANLLLAGTFTRPEKKGKYPAVILITGSGPENRDETVFGHKPFLVLADYLTRKGFAVLRCDDRGTAKSTGDYAGTSADYATDVVAQLEYLKTRKDVDAKRTGLLGHSEGGLIAPLVAAHRNDVAFVALWAGPAIDMYELLLIQDSLVLASEEASATTIRQSVERNKKIFEFIINTPDSAAAADSIDKYLSAAHTSDQEIASTLRLVDGRWMRWFIGFDPRENLGKLLCPVLAINGGKDVQVPAEINISSIRETLTRSGNKNFKAEVLPGLNHLFQKCKKCSVAEYVNIDETINPVALQVTGDWLEENFLKKK